MTSQESLSRAHCTAMTIELRLALPFSELILLWWFVDVCGFPHGRLQSLVIVEGDFSELNQPMPHLRHLKKLSYEGLRNLALATMVRQVSILVVFLWSTDRSCHCKCRLSLRDQLPVLRSDNLQGTAELINVISLDRNGIAMTCSILRNYTSATLIEHSTYIYNTSKCLVEGVPKVTEDETVAVWLPQGVPLVTSCDQSWGDGEIERKQERKKEGKG